MSALAMPSPCSRRYETVISRQRLCVSGQLEERHASTRVLFI